MKKTKKFLSAVTVMAMLISSLNIFSAPAEAYLGWEHTNVENYIPEGYRPIRFYMDYPYSEGIDSVDERGYQAYVCINNPQFYKIKHAVQMNHTRIEIPAEEDFDKVKAIIEKYNEQLDFDCLKYDYYKVNTIYAYDRFDSEGNPTMRMADVGDKSELVKEMVEEIYSAVEVKSANYEMYSALLDETFIYSTCRIHNVPLSLEELDAFVKEFDDSLTVSLTDGGYYELELNDRFEVIWELRKKLMDTYEESYVSVDFDSEMGGNSTTMSSGNIDLLAEIQAENNTVYGDINIDGKIGILDAIYMNKSIIQSITLNDAQTTAADLNGDGAVNNDDMDILLKYLVNKIDAMPLDK